MNIPKHIAMVMDGNGRWAVKRGKPRTYGHQVGGEHIFKIAEKCHELGVKYITLYAFSTENWSRPTAEVHFITRELPFLIYNKFKSRLKSNNMKFLLSGRLEGIPKKSLELFRELEQTSKDNEGLTIVFAFNYGGRAEIIDVCKNLLDINIKSSELTEDIFRSNLYLPNVPDVDLVIRAGNEHRISNFLLWQIAYAELYMSEKLWPDFTAKDLTKAIEFYSNRNRKFGKISV
ncbi:di-trans,poly-cis-decaprenylcistransferase [Clostridium sp. 'deep sea']|uniref:polyprenyl diphosphate synthase n=1 Tax=Clostridium sp. 'deep sea' TaxID=2779445 RepID=UPI00189646CE|nr:polyprenyl diphosphate synthase [Clostridium sp. 'deep sea']QOR36028.1 di-trans,poly-cis-decaprenylcistransferase [Clostridium sp. 'deep sea']